MSQNVKCSACGANIEVEDGREFCFCSYCGSKITLESKKKETVITKNININKNVHKRYTNDAEVIKAKNADREDRRFWIGMLAMLVVSVSMLALPLLVPKIIDSSARSEGKISAGNCEDLIGEDYTVVEAHFVAAGFTNIELIDLDDSGIAFWTEGEVKSISVGGDMDFDSYDYFYPDTKVVISYH